MNKEKEMTAPNVSVGADTEQSSQNLTDNAKGRFCVLYPCYEGSTNTGVLLCHSNGSHIFDFKCDKSRLVSEFSQNCADNDI